MADQNGYSKTELERLSDLGIYPSSLGIFNQIDGHDVLEIYSNQEIFDWDDSGNLLIINEVDAVPTDIGINLN